MAACRYDPDTETFQSFCKVMSGFSDEMYKELTAKYKQLALPAAPAYYNVSDSLTPSVWFPPTEVSCTLFVWIDEGAVMRA
mgnify:CR=1 FL=1